MGICEAYKKKKSKFFPPLYHKKIECYYVWQLSTNQNKKEDPSKRVK
jgi:hypothetical protein